VPLASHARAPIDPARRHEVEEEEPAYLLVEDDFGA
jgi:hypothetical protein